MKLKIYTSLFFISCATALLALVSFCMSTRTCAHYSNGENIASLISGSLRITHPIPGRTFISIPTGFSTTEAESAAWVPSASMGASLWQFDLPLWLPAALSALFAAAIYRRAFLNPGFCGHCKYNLSGLEDASRCPECGHAIVPEVQSTPGAVPAC